MGGRSLRAAPSSFNSHQPPAFFRGNAPTSVLGSAPMAGYSGTPLPRKLGIKSGHAVAHIDAPEGFDDTLGELPPGVTVRTTLRASDVFDVLVVGVPDDRFIERVAVIVKVRDGVDAPTLEELQEFCRTKIAGYKVPRELHLTDEIPRTPVGKPDYRWAKATALSHLEQDTPAREAGEQAAGATMTP